MVCLLMWLYLGSMIVTSLDILPYFNMILLYAGISLTGSVGLICNNTYCSTPYRLQSVYCTCVPPVTYPGIPRPLATESAPLLVPRTKFRAFLKAPGGWFISESLSEERTLDKKK